MNDNFSQSRLFILMLIVCQLLTVCCTRQAVPGQSFPNIKSQSEKKELKTFLDSGTEKNLETRGTKPEEIISTARKYIGVPHCMGGTTMKCMDCSGLLFTVFREYGIALPHNSEEQARYGKIIPEINDLKKGDLVFFIRTYNTNRFITHSGIYIGDSKFIHTSTSKGVTVTSLYDPWWNGKFVFGKRVFD
ncbi:MAG TPA: C40 family peptidase [Bacteroidales bacterium]|nr:C40 family peptidase [Bacteroidales bacterium]HPR73447.1 C40 family peptidase [Bacteroidales bacterium]